MRKIFLLFFLMILLLAVMSGCSTNVQSEKSEAHEQESSDKKVELTVSAASSLQDALKDIKSSFEKKHPNVIINYNFGASGALQQQISQGAPVDVFFSADEDKFQKLVSRGWTY